MKKALLVGNGVTSQLIVQYQDKKMMDEFKKIDSCLYDDINHCLDPFRQLENKDEKPITDLLVSFGIPYYDYSRYFVQQNLLEELGKKEILGLETILKVAHLFNHFKNFNYETIKKIGNEIYYNNGSNGLSVTNLDVKCKENFCKMVSDFDDIYTTNFDTILDDATEREVKHLHGGFNYVKKRVGPMAIVVEREDKIKDPHSALLIWGREENEKTTQMRGGFTEMAFPFQDGNSILDNYLSSLENNVYDELHIWGYSGMNDGHINNAIINNNGIKKIVYYGEPSKIDSPEYKYTLNNLFVHKEDQSKFHLESWDNIWGRVYQK